MRNSVTDKMFIDAYTIFNQMFTATAYLMVIMVDWKVEERAGASFHYGVFVAFFAFTYNSV